MSNNNFDYTGAYLDQLSGLMSDSDDFNTMAQELNKLTESLIANLPKPSQQMIEEYQNDMDAMLSVGERYQERYDELARQISEDTVRIEYASGGELLHRGYHCPSPLLDKLVGGYKRGRKVREPKAGTKYYYKYYYDEHNRMLRCDKYEGNRCLEIEFMINEDDHRYGLSFLPDCNAINRLSLEKYSAIGLLGKYLTVLPDFYTGEQNHSIHTSEKYEYDENNQIAKVVFVSGGVPKLKLLQEEMYTVLRDEHQAVVGFKADKM